MHSEILERQLAEEITLRSGSEFQIDDCDDVRRIGQIIAAEIITIKK